MPLFFLLSGVFYNSNKISKRIKNLLYPYISFMLLASIIEIAKRCIVDENVDWMHILAPLFGETSNYPNTPCWFLFSLIQINLIAYILQKVSKKPLALCTMSLVVSIGGYVWGLKNPNVKYYVDVSMLCNFFFILGFISKKYILDILDYKVALFLLLSNIIIFYFLPSGCNVSQNSLGGSYPMFLLISTISSLGVIGCSRALENTKLGDILEYYGRNSLIVLCTHIIILNVIFKLLLKLHLSNGIQTASGTILIMIVEIPVIWIINNYFPFLIGKSKIQQ